MASEDCLEIKCNMPYNINLTDEEKETIEKALTVLRDNMVKVKERKAVADIDTLILKFDDTWPDMPEDGIGTPVEDE